MNVAADTPAAMLSSAQAVLLLCVAVIGLGNIWLLPSLIVNHGGGAFLLVYLLALLGLGVPVFMAELAYGKLARERLGAATHASARGLGLNTTWLLIRFAVPLAGAALIALYGAIAGWSFGYLFRAASGAAQATSSDAAERLFLSLAADPERSLVWHTLFWVAIGTISSQGWRDGLLRAAIWFGGLIVLLVLWLADSLPALASAGDAGARFFQPRWGDLGWDGVIAALTQACFTLTVGLGMVYAVGCRLGTRARVGHIALAVAAIDLGFSLLLGVPLAALLVGQGGAVGTGVSLVFIDLVVATAGSSGVQIALFALLLLLSAGSAMLLIEPFVQSLQARAGWGREKAAVGVSALAWLAGIFVVLSFGPWSNWELFGLGLVEWLVYLGVNLLIPLNCLLLAAYVGRALPPPAVAMAGGEGLAITALWYWLLRYPVRLLLLVLLLYSSGIMRAVWQFFQLPE